MQEKLLFVVKDCFTIKGRGTVLTAQVSGEIEHLLTPGLDMVIRHASGSEWQCTVQDVKREAAAPNAPVGILISQAVKIPTGSRAFLRGQPPAA